MLFVDDMRKEIKLYTGIMIFCGCIAVLCPLVFYFKYANTESVLMDTLKVAAIFAVFF